LVGAPTNVGRDFYCSYNQLTNLKGAPTTVGRDFVCSYNPKLESLEGAPTNVGRDFYCSKNPKLPKEEIERYKNSDAVKGKFKHD
jgi:hypothetical protein